MQYIRGGVALKSHTFSSLVAKTLCQHSDRQSNYECTNILTENTMDLPVYNVVGFCSLREGKLVKANEVIFLQYLLSLNIILSQQRQRIGHVSNVSCL